MTSILSRWLSKFSKPEPLQPGVYHYQSADDAPIPYRLHLRIEPEGTGVLIVNAATVLHLNTSATAHALQIVQGADQKEAASAVAARFRVSREKAFEDQEIIRQKIEALATNPDIDPVLFLDLDRSEPYASMPTAPYRLDVALTYATDPEGQLDPLARARVDRELTTEEWKSILSKAWDAGIPHITFTGGEPTRREDLPELVRFAEKLGQVTGILTEGRRLSNSDYVEELSQAGLDHFLIVLVPEDPDNLAGIKNAVASDVYTAVHLTLGGENGGKTEAWMRDLSNLGVQAISLSSPETASDMTEALATARELAAHLNMDLIWDLPTPYSQNHPIALEVESAHQGAGRAWLYIEPDGDVLPSQGVDLILGNFGRDPWPDIWRKAMES